MSNFTQIVYSNLISTRTGTYERNVDPIRAIFMLPVLIVGLFATYGFAFLIEDEKSIRAFEAMFELLPMLGLAILLMFAGVGIFFGLFTIIYPIYSKIHKIVNTPQQVETLEQKIETITDNKQEANKVLELLYKMKQYFDDEQPPDAKIHNLESKCEEQGWKIKELKHENKMKDTRILNLENKVQNMNIRLDELENEKKEKIQIIGDRAKTNNNTENTDLKKFKEGL